MRTHIHFPALRAPLSPKGRGELRGAHAHPFPGAARHPLPQGERENIAMRTHINLPALCATRSSKGMGSREQD